MELGIPAWLEDVFEGLGNIASAFASAAPVWLDLAIVFSYLFGLGTLIWGLVLASKIASGRDPKGRGMGAFFVVFTVGIALLHIPDVIDMTMRTAGGESTYQTQSTLCDHGTVGACTDQTDDGARANRVNLWFRVAFSILSFVGVFVVIHSLMRTRRIGEGSSAQDTYSSCVIQFIAGVLLANLAEFVGYM